MTLRTILCMSTLRVDANAIGTLFRETRSIGEAACIQGAIVSDGERVAHFLHGREVHVMAMLSRIRTDDRLAHATTLPIQEIDQEGGAWPLSGWKAGWATTEVLDAMVTGCGPGSAGTLAPCLQLLLQCDLL